MKFKIYKFRDMRVFSLYILFLIISIGIYLRICNLGKQSIWLDEARAFFRAQRSIQELWNNQAKESNPPLYDTLLHYSLKFSAKKNEFQIRLLSAMFGILIIPLAFFLGRRMFNSRIGIIFSLLMAISPYHIYYSQDAKMYTLLALLSPASYFLYYLSLESGKIFYWTAYTLITLLLIYTHNYSFLLFAAQIATYFIFYKKFKMNLLKFLLSNLIILILSIPRITCIYQQAFMDINPWISLPSPNSITQTFQYFCFLFWHMQLTGVTIVASIIGFPIYIFILGLAIFVKDKNENKAVNKFNEPEELSFLLFYLFIPLAFLFLISFKKPIFVPGRYDMSVFSACILIISFGLNKIKKNIHRNLLIAGIIAATSICLHNYYYILNKSTDRIIADYVQSRMNKDDIWVFTDLSVSPFRYYSRLGPCPNIFSFPLTDPGWLPKKAIKADKDYVSNEINKLKNKIQPFLKKGNFLRVLYTDIKINQLLVEELKNNYKLLDVIKFSRGRNDNQITAMHIFGIYS